MLWQMRWAIKVTEVTLGFKGSDSSTGVKGEGEARWSLEEHKQKSGREMIQSESYKWKDNRGVTYWGTVSHLRAEARL